MVQDATGNEDTRMIGTLSDKDDCKIMMFAMPEHSASASSPRIFCSYPLPNHQMVNSPIWQALRVTMSHPEPSNSIEIGDASRIDESLVGSDVGCSNLTSQVLAEVSALCPDRHIASIVCIGSGHTRTINNPHPNPPHRIMPINASTALKNVAIDNERVPEEAAMRFEDAASVYFRFCVDQGLQGARTSQWQRLMRETHTQAYMRQVGVKKKIDEAAQSIVARKKTLSWKVQQPQEQLATGVKRCPAPSSVFTGCEHHISQISSCLSGTAERRICVVHGLGGAGKTQIALKVVERTSNRWTDIIYVDAASRETTQSTLKGFAMARKIGDTHEDAIRWLESSPQPWLLVFDNADDPELNLPNFIPGGYYGSVLITTRLRNLAPLGQGPGSDCDVGRMDRDEAVELLLKIARMHDQALSIEEMEAATNLVEVGTGNTAACIGFNRIEWQNLGYLALAIVHAGAYIWRSGSSIADYRERFLADTRAALERYSKLPGNIEEYDRTLYTTWQMSYERLKPRTQQLLGLMAYLHHEGITEDIFRRAAGNTRRALVIPPSDDEVVTRKYVQDYLELFLDADGHWDSSAFLALIDELLLCSLIDYDRVNNVYMLHVLVQDWTRTTIPYPKIAALRHASHLVALSIDWSSDITAHAFRRGLSLHVGGLLGNPNEIDANDAAYLARVCEENSRWNDAEALEARALNARKQTLGERHLDTLISMSNLAGICSKQGRWGEAEVLQEQALDAMEQTLGEHHPDTLATMNNLAMIYWRQGRWDKAEVLQVQVLNKIKKTLGERHPDTLTVMDNLAMTYSDRGRWSEAEALQIQVLNSKKRTFGEDHPDTLSVLNDLATTYSDWGRWSEAEALQVQVLDAVMQLLGERHPSTIASMNSLAMTYWRQGRWDEAEALQARVLEAAKKTLGELHPDTLTIMSNLATTYSDRGRWDEAEALQIQVLEARKQTLGGHHPDTLTSMNNLAVTYSRRGRWDEAEAPQVQVSDARKQIFGEHHPGTLTIMNNLATTYSGQGRWSEAEALQVQVLEARKQTLGELHPDTLTIMSNLATTYSDRGRWDEAEALQIQVLEARKQTLGGHHPDTLTSMNNLAVTHSRQGRWDKAEALQVQVLDARKQIFGEHHPGTLTIMNNLATTYSGQGRWSEAEALQVQVLEARKQTLGEHHPDTLASMNNLAVTYSRQGRWGEAEVLQALAVDGRKRALGKYHPQTLTAMKWLAFTYRNQGRNRVQRLKALEKKIRKREKKL
ncbi:hypothetical protein FRC06_002248 [Ceratobasidium sp. 370]|nr:hypothetical protein FRC06_002248 [Ceratobasidium sp. 370]